MRATQPADLDRLFEQLLNAADLEGLVALYEPNASLTLMRVHEVTGTSAIREALRGLLASRPRITIASVRVVAQTMDLALVSAEWRVTASGPDGKPSNTSGSSIEIARRQADGRWLFAIDKPFGVSVG
jgi:uncharacterized protein (TIGR02246 family)